MSILTYCNQPASQRASQRVSQPASQQSSSSAILIAGDPYPRPQRSSAILILCHTHPEPSIFPCSVTFILIHPVPQQSASSSLQPSEFVPSHAHHQQSSSSLMPRRALPAPLKSPAPCKPRMRWTRRLRRSPIPVRPAYGACGTSPR